MSVGKSFPILLAFAIGVKALNLICNPGKEFTSQNITALVGTDLDVSFQWQKNGTELASCIKMPYSSTYACDVSNNCCEVYVNGTKRILIILNVTKESIGTYILWQNFTIQNGPRSGCIFTVYAGPESVTCLNTVNTGNKLTVVCTIMRIYPLPLCQFLQETNGTLLTSLTNGKYELMSYGDPEYFYANCSVDLQLETLGLGTHRFKVLAYPNVTGRDSDTAYGRNSSFTSAINISFPIAKLEGCLDSIYQEFTRVTCSCRDTSNTFIQATLNFYNGTMRLAESQGMLTYTFIMSRYVGIVYCQATWLNFTSAAVNLTPQVAIKASVLLMKVNNEENIGVERYSSINFSCVAEGNPRPIVSLTKNGVVLSSASHPDQKFTLTLEFNKQQTDCRDTGVYVCQAGQSKRNVTVSVFCSQQLVDPRINDSVYSTSANTPISITIPIYGFPEPDYLQINGFETQLNELEYRLSYIREDPPFGRVLINIMSLRPEVFQNYTVNITNSKGSLLYRFQIKQTLPVSSSKSTDVGVIVGSFFGGVAAAVVIGAIVYMLQRKGVCNRKKDRTPGSGTALKIDTLSHTEDTQYENAVNRLEQSINETVAASQYEEIVNLDSHPQRSSLKYANLRTSDSASGAKAEYENTVPSF